MSKIIIMHTRQSELGKKLNREVLTLFRSSRVKPFTVATTKGVTFDDLLSDKMLMIAAIRAGIPFTLFELIQKSTPFDEKDWVEFLDLSSKSLQRYKLAPGHVFKSIHSEKILEMAEVTKVGLDVFGDMEKFRLWLNTPNYALGKLKPIELLKDSYGKEMVIGELVRISHGILA